MGRKSGRKIYRFVDTVVESATREMLTAGVVSDEDKARKVAVEIAKKICFVYAKTIMYVPADLQFELAERDKLIWDQYSQDGPDGVRKFTPLRVSQLAETHNLTVAHIYCIVRICLREQRDAERRDLDSRQGRIPGLEDQPTSA